MTHHIRQLFLHVEVNGPEADGLALQHRLPEWCLHDLLPAIEQVMERYDPAGAHLCIERLEVAAGTLSLERVEHDLTELVRRALEQLLRAEMTAAAAGPVTTPGNVQHRTALQTVHEAWVYFLRTGTLPWSFRPAHGKEMSQTLLDAWQAASPDDPSLRAADELLRRVLAESPVRQRLLRQFSADFRHRLLARLAPAVHSILVRVLDVLRRRETTPVVAEDVFLRPWWDTALSYAAAGRVGTETQLVGEGWRSGSGSLADQPTLAAFLERQWPGVAVAFPDQPVTAATPRDHGNPSTPAPLPWVTRPETDRAGRTEARPDDLRERRDHWYLGNAGLVLLHPFLPQFFGSLGLTAGEKLLQPERAMCLLHFLATGQTAAPEYELLLPKVLCNVAPETPVEAEVGLTEAEKNEAQALLAAVIRHWDALRSTTPDGLRGTFLLRPGKLSLRDDGDWLLQVEPQSFDILLDQLPWGISMIHLPWMKRILRVEWR